MRLTYFVSYCDVDNQAYTPMELNTANCVFVVFFCFVLFVCLLLLFLFFFFFFFWGGGGGGGERVCV